VRRNFGFPQPLFVEIIRTVGLSGAGPKGRRLFPETPRPSSNRTREGDVERSPNPLDRHVVVDLETTGLSPRHGHRIIEIGAVAIENGAIVEEFTTLIDPGVPIPTRVQAIHGITEEMLEGQPPPEEALPRFYGCIADSVLIAHNAAFEVTFLRHEFSRLKLGFPNRHVCTLEMSRRSFPRLSDHTLETVYLHLFPDVDFIRQSHRALDDARMTAQIWLAMEEKS
jgi:DNA polymerase-3 subunit epsilon